MNKILVFSLVTGLLAGALGILFIDLKLIPGIIGGLVSGVFIWAVLSKVNKSDNYPYWKQDKK